VVANRGAAPITLIVGLHEATPTDPTSGTSPGGPASAAGTIRFDPETFGPAKFAPGQSETFTSILAAPSGYHGTVDIGAANASTMALIARTSTLFYSYGSPSPADANLESGSGSSTATGTAPQFFPTSPLAQSSATGSPTGGPSPSASPSPGALLSTLSEHETAVAAGGGLGLLGAAAAAALWIRRRLAQGLGLGPLGLLAAPFVGLFTRIEKPSVLEQQARKRVYEAIASSPGIHFTALKDAVGLGSGALVHHLSMLEHHRMIVKRREGRLARFWVASAPVPAAAPTLTPLQARIVLALQTGPLPRRALAEKLSISRQLAEHHLRRLEHAGLVEATEANGVRVWTVPAPRGTAIAPESKGAPAEALATAPA
jgi:DNA-binding MarR family transcriptional regulator